MVFDLADEVNLYLEDWNDATRVHGCQSEAQVKVGLVDQMLISPEQIQN